MPINARGYFDFLKAMAFRLRWGDVDALTTRDRDTLDTLIQDAAHKTFFPLKPGTDTVHQWSWADPLRSLIVRSAVTGTLLDVPSRSGEEIIFRANEAIFDADLVGHDVTFDTTEMRYTITDFVRDSVIKAIPSERSPQGQTNVFGERIEVTVDSATKVPITQTTITGGHATKVFDASMVGDLAVFASGNSYYISRVDVDNDQIIVSGDASAETLVMTIERSTDLLGFAIGNKILAIAGTFREDMADDTDSVVFGATSTAYDMDEFSSSEIVSLVGTFTTVESSLDTVTIKKSFGTGYTVAANISETFVTIVEDDVFQAAHVDSYLTSLKDNKSFGLFIIVEVLDDKRVKVSGNATQLLTGTIALTRAGGRLSQSDARTYDGASTLLTMDAAIAASISFTSGMIGLTMDFIFTNTKYAIVEFVSATQVKVAGNASQEGYPSDAFIISGPTDLAADAAFTVVNTGGDYELPEDYGGMDGAITYLTDSLLRTILIGTEQTVRISRQRDSSTGYPRIASISPQIHDGRFTQRYMLKTYPIASSKFTVEFRQRVILPKINADNPFPPGGAAFGDLYQAACLAEVESRVLNIVHGGSWTEFQEALARMIEFDKMGSGPEWMGRGYEEGRRVTGRRFPRTGDVTYVTT